MSIIVFAYLKINIKIVQYNLKLFYNSLKNNTMDRSRYYQGITKVIPRPYQVHVKSKIVHLVFGHEVSMVGFW